MRFVAAAAAGPRRMRTPIVKLVVGHGAIGAAYAPSRASRELIYLARVNSMITTGADSIELDSLVAGLPVNGIKKLGDILDTAGLNRHPFYIQITGGLLYSTDGREIRQGIHVIRRGRADFIPLDEGTYSLNDLAAMSDGDPIIVSACPEGAFGDVMGIPQHVFQVGGGKTVAVSELHNAIKIVQSGGGLDKALKYLDKRAL